MSGRQKAGGLLMVLGYLVYLIASILALGALFNGCVAIAKGDVSSLIFAVGSAVVIGWIGQLVGGIIMAGGGAVAGDE